MSAAESQRALRRFKPYSAYKDCGVEWLGKIPARWQVMRLKTLASLRAGAAITSDRIEPNGDYPVFGGNGLRGYTSSYTHDGEVPLVGRQGALCGCVCFATGKFWASEHAIVVTPRTAVDTHWLADLLQAMSLNAYSQSAAQPGLAVEAIGIIPVPAPPIEEQRGITAFLDRETAKIDALAAKKQRLIELLQEKRTALITGAVTKGLDPNVPVKGSGVEWLGEILAHWEIARLRHATVKIGSGKTPSGGAEVYVSEGVMLLRSQNVHFAGLRLADVAFIDAVTDAEMAGSRVQEGDVLLNITGASLGRCCVALINGTPANVNQHVCVIRPRSRLFDAEFLAAAIASRAVQAQIFNTENGISRDALNFEQIGQLRVARPPLGEQHDIVVFCNRETAKIDALIEKIRDAMDRLKEMRTALISAAVTGKIDVRGKAA